MNRKSPYVDAFLESKEKFSNLKFSERGIISMTYFFRDKKYIKSARLDKTEKEIFKKLFIDLHVLFFLKVIKGSNYYTISRLIQNFLFLRAKENIRLVLFAYNPFNLTAFVHGIRSQIEINALLNRFTKENDSYFEEYFLKSEDRKSQDKLINIQTLIDKMDNTIINYRAFYDMLSNVLHPNPRAVMLHAQVTHSGSEHQKIHHPNISYYFDETMPYSTESEVWFKTYLFQFVVIIIHFFELIEKLDKHFFINEKEKNEFEAFSLHQIVNSKEFLNYLYTTKPEEINMEEFLKWMEKKKGKF